MLNSNNGREKISSLHIKGKRMGRNRKLISIQKAMSSLNSQSLREVQLSKTSYEVKLNQRRCKIKSN